MKGYLLKETNIIIGDGCFIESEAPEGAFAVVFEDDKDTGYFYAAEKDTSGTLVILDMVFIYDVESVATSERKVKLAVIWSTDWKRCGLILNDTCHAVFDFENKEGFNLTGFPEPVLWKSNRKKLTEEMVNRFFK